MLKVGDKAIHTPTGDVVEITKVGAVTYGVLSGDRPFGSTVPQEDVEPYFGLRAFTKTHQTLINERVDTKSLLQQLEDWVSGHKARYCEIGIDNGYGATSWDVVLWHENGVVKTIEGHGEIMIYNKPKGYKPLSELFYNDYEIIKLDNDDWVGLEKTLEVALDIVGSNG